MWYVQALERRFDIDVASDVRNRGLIPYILYFDFNSKSLAISNKQ